MTADTSDELELSSVPVIDADSHVTEPTDLWTSRLPSKWRAEAPQAMLHPQTGHHHWRIGDTWLHPVGHFTQAGWKEYPPSTPSELEETDPAGHDPYKRLERMDEYGISAQILYPNIIGFNSTLFMQMEPQLSLACTRAYNDFITEWSNADPDRLVPIGMVPFWDLDASVVEMQRCAELGHHGILFANRYERVGLPAFTDTHWDPIYSAAEGYNLSINFHIGFSEPDMTLNLSSERLGARLADDSWRTSHVTFAARLVTSHVDILANLVTSDLCGRFPTVKFVSVESGFGYVPFLLECLDWHWRATGLHLDRELLPSEYFRRQCYGTFWFERGTLRLLEDYPDNFMFSTDFPHSTSLSPGPASPAEIPSAHISNAFRNLPSHATRKALHENARLVYSLG